MKAINLIGLLIILSVLGSCKSEKGDELSELKAQLDEKKKTLNEINLEIQSLENQIRDIDSTFAQGLAKVRTQRVTKGKFEKLIPFQGETEAESMVELSPETPGLITFIGVREGQKIGRGQLVASLDATDIQKSLDEIQINLDLAKIVYQKRERLWQQKIGSEIEYLNAKAQVESLERRKASVNAQLSKFRLRSPIAGTVERVNAKKGELGAPGVPVAIVVNSGQLKVVAEVSETFAARIQRGDDVVLKISGFEGTVNSKLSRVGQLVNPENRTFEIEAKLNNNKGQFKPNMMASISLVEYKADDVISIPTKYIHFGSQENYVFIIKEAMRTTSDSTAQNEKITLAQKVPVTVGQTADGRSEITQGLQGNELLITDGFQSIIDQQEVNLLN